MTTLTTYEEWRVTGQPGEMFSGVDWPPYEFTWSTHNHSGSSDPEGDARRFIALVREHDTWRDGPHLHRRTVTVTDWEDA